MCWRLPSVLLCYSKMKSHYGTKTGVLKKTIKQPNSHLKPRREIDMQTSINDKGQQQKNKVIIYVKEP